MESQSNAIKATSKGMRRTEKICLSPPHRNVRRKEIVPKFKYQLASNERMNSVYIILDKNTN